MIRRTALAVIVLSLLCSVTAGGFCQDQGLDQTVGLLDKIREATGHAALRSWEHGVHAAGEGEASGLKCRFGFYLVADGMFRMQLDSELKSIKGFDGHQGWQVDYTGMPYPLEYWELEVEKLVAWVIGGHWLDPDCELELSLISEAQNQSTVQVLAHIPGGVVYAVIHVDKDSYLPQKVTWNIYEGENSLQLRDQKRVSGFYFPHRITITEDGDVTDLRVKDVREASHASLDACSPITTPPADTFFSKEISPVIESRFTDNGLLVRPSIDGWDNAWFILDTGTSCNVIDKGIAKKLKMELFGKGKAIGVGGSIDIKFRNAERVELGPVLMTGPVFVEIDLSYSDKPQGSGIGGILGFDFLSRCVIEIDLQDKVVSIRESSDFGDDDIAWEEIIFCSDLPAVACRLSGGHQGIFTVDTGSTGCVIFNREFVSKHNLTEGKDLQPVGLQGVGGEVPGYQSRIDWFEIGGHRIENPRVVFADSERGASSDRVMAGSIGGELLLGFKSLVLDYPHKRIGFVR